MCYDISFSTRYEVITDYIPGLAGSPQLTIDYPSMAHVQAQAYRKYPVIIFEDGKYKLREFEWGVIATFMNTPEKIRKQRSSMCNARSEKILDDTRSYWHRIRKNRCLIPVTGIYEHREVKGFRNKIPYLVWLKDREIFCLPGLYQYPGRADVETGEITGTFTLITRAANTIMSQIHNSGEQAFRMPLFLPKNLELKWIDPSNADDDLREILGFEMPSENICYRTVFTIRGSRPRPDDKQKTDAYDWPGLPPLGMDTTEQSLF